MLKLKAHISVRLPLLKDLSMDTLPLTIGALTLNSKDGLREYMLDSTSSTYVNDQREGTDILLETTFAVDLETFPLGHENYNIKATDLSLDECKGEFYCSDVDCEDGEDCFDYDNAEVECTVTDIDTGIEYKIPVTLDV